MQGLLCYLSSFLSIFLACFLIYRRTSAGSSNEHFQEENTGLWVVRGVALGSQSVFATLLAVCFLPFLGLL